jgi:threonine dehydrogenase-like Zn-dependent dehydrogenase
MLFEPGHTRLAGAWDIDKAQRWLLAAFANGRCRLDRLVTHRIPPGRLGEAYDGLMNRKEEYLGVVIDWEG